GEPEPRPIAADTRRFIRARAWAETRRAMAEAGEAAVRVDDLHPEVMADWNDDQWQRAEASGLLERLPEQAWVEITNESEASAATEPGQSSTSSTFPDSGEEEEGG
ncbi:MAG TPA: hypothetical protein VEA60_12865, partial [Allosphingosinicella sp.]|nr:hypothetical protein [Allosphingosinicella sp.]